MFSRAMMRFIDTHVTDKSEKIVGLFSGFSKAAIALKHRFQIISNETCAAAYFLARAHVLPNHHPIFTQLHEWQGQDPVSRRP